MKNLLILLAFFFSVHAFSQTKATLKLFIAIEKNNLSAARNALYDGADVNGVDNMSAPTTTAFLKAVKLNRLEIVKLLIQNKADVNQRRPMDLFSGLMIAAKYDHDQMVQLLLDNKADVNAESVIGRTALITAAQNNSINAAKILLSREDINVNARPELCALAVAARQDHSAIVMLIKSQKNDKASSAPCVERAIRLAEMNKNTASLSILKRVD
jgi:ankyrin repeat protein